MSVEDFQQRHFGSLFGTIKPLIHHQFTDDQLFEQQLQLKRWNAYRKDLVSNILIEKQQEKFNRTQNCFATSKGFDMRSGTSFFSGKSISMKKAEETFYKVRARTKKYINDMTHAPLILNLKSKTAFSSTLNKWPKRNHAPLKVPSNDLFEDDDIFRDN